MVALDEALVTLDAQRRTTTYRVERGGKLHPNGVAAAPAERFASLVPSLTLQRAAAVVAADARGRDALVVTGAHWDGSLCVAHAHGGTANSAASTGAARLQWHSEWVTAVAVSACGSWLLSGSLDGTSMLWSLGSAGLASLLPHAVAAAAVSAAASAADVAAAAAPRQPQNTEPTHVLRGHSAAVLCVALSSTLRLAASGSRDGTAALYALRNGRRVRVLREPDGALVDQILLADNGYVAMCGAAGARVHLFTLNGLRVWSVDGGGCGISALCLSPSGGELVMGGEDGSVRAYALADANLITQYQPCAAPVVSLALSDAHLFAATSRADLVAYLPPNPSLSGVHAGAR